MIAALIGVVGVALGAFLTHWLAAEKEREARARASAVERLAFYQQLRIHLDASRAAFENQVALRNRLVAGLERRYGASDLEYEPLFKKYHPQMNDEERFLCKQMRGITETLHSHNSAVRALLTRHPALYDEVPGFKALYEHLDLWISKYNRPFKEREDQCLVYVGVAESKGFPSGVDEQIRRRIEELQHELPRAE